MNPFNRRSYSGVAPDTTLSAGIDATTLTISVASGTGWPDGTGGPFEVIFEPDTASEEKCWASARSGNSITLLARGMEGAATSHAGTTTVVRHGFSALDADEANNAVSQTIGQIAAKGDLLVGSGANTLTKVSAGATGTVPIWQSDGSVAAGAPAPAAHTHAEADVTSLVTDLGNKLAKPATAFAKGSVITGTGAGTFDNTAVGTDNAVLTADSTATGGVSWKTPAAGLLAWARSAVTGVSKSSSGGGLSAIDSTGATVTFTAPASGKVLVKVSANAHGSNAGFLGATVHGASTVAAGLRDPVNGALASVDNRYATTIPVTGLTAGTSYSYDAAGGCDGSNGCTFGNAMIEIWSAP